MSAQGADGDARLTQASPPAVANASSVDERVAATSASAIAVSSTPRPANGTAATYSSAGNANKHVPSVSTSALPRRLAGSASTPPQAGSLGRPSTPSRGIGRAQSPSGASSAEQRRVRVCFAFRF